MKGKKIDAEFVSEFICSCAQKNKINSEDICKEAELQISIIEEKIKEAENLKIKRSKLKDVIISLSNKKEDKSKDKDILSYYSIDNISIAYLIALKLSLNNIDISLLNKDEIHIAKQMQLNNIIKRSDTKKFLIADKNLKSFMEFYEKNYNAKIYK